MIFFSYQDVPFTVVPFILTNQRVFYFGTYEDSQVAQTDNTSNVKLAFSQWAEMDTRNLALISSGVS